MDRCVFASATGQAIAIGRSSFLGGEPRRPHAEERTVSKHERMLPKPALLALRGAVLHIHRVNSFWVGLRFRFSGPFSFQIVA
jgi:hypothetical protein